MEVLRVCGCCVYVATAYTWLLRVRGCCELLHVACVATFSGPDIMPCMFSACVAEAWCQCCKYVDILCGRLCMPWWPIVIVVASFLDIVSSWREWSILVLLHSRLCRPLPYNNVDYDFHGCVFISSLAVTT